MDKDQIQGSVEQAKGKVKEVAGKVSGDAKLETEGKTQQVAGKLQNAVGGFKDAVKGASKINDDHLHNVRPPQLVAFLFLSGRRRDAVIGTKRTSVVALHVSRFRE